jgi:hypothetical protein
MSSRQENSMLFDQIGLTGMEYETEDQYLRLTAIDGINGLYYQIETKGSWSFSEPDDITKLIERFVKISEGLR